jgi:hypothetical protein
MTNNTGRKLMTLEEYNNLSKQTRYYYRKNRPELLINISKEDLYKPNGRKKELNEQQRQQMKMKSNREYREKLRTNKYINLTNDDLNIKEPKYYSTFQRETHTTNNTDILQILVVEKSFIDLLDELIIDIMLWIGKLEQIIILSSVCKKLRLIGKSNNLWMKLLIRDFKINDNKDFSYLAYYKYKSKIKKLRTNIDIDNKIVFFNIDISLCNDEKTIMIKYKEKTATVEYNKQNTKDFNIQLCELIYGIFIPCPYCTDMVSRGLLRRSIVKRDTPNKGRIYYRCSVCGTFEWQDGEPSLQKDFLYQKEKYFEDYVYYFSVDDDDNDDRFNLPL